MTKAGSVVARAINDLSREDFRRIFVGGLCQKAEFGHLVATGANDLSVEEKSTVLDVISCFVPSDNTLSDDDLDMIAWIITSRSVALR